jgi:RNA-directed DNA polymerase
VALSVLDEYIAQAPGGPSASHNERVKRRRRNLPNYRLCRYADDWCLVIHGTKADAEALRDEIAVVLARMGLRLSADKTLITHIDGLDFLGWHIQRHRKRGTDQRYVYTYPAKKSLQAAKAKVRTLCQQVDTNQPLETLLQRLNPAAKGWCAHFRPGVSSETFQYLSSYLWERAIGWIRRKHPRITWRELRRRFCAGGWWPTSGDIQLFNPAKVRTTRYRYRGVTGIPSPWPTTG